LRSSASLEQDTGKKLVCQKKCGENKNFDVLEYIIPRNLKIHDNGSRHLFTLDYSIKSRKNPVALGNEQVICHDFNKKDCFLRQSSEIITSPQKEQHIKNTLKLKNILLMFICKVYLC